MKVKVIDTFRDKYTNEVYKIETELEVTKERYLEMKDHVEVKKSKVKATDDESKVKATGDESQGL